MTCQKTGADGIYLSKPAIQRYSLDVADKVASNLAKFFITLKLETALTQYSYKSLATQ